MKILVCDDDHEIVEAISIYLKNEGYETVKAYTGAQAVKAVDEGGIGLAIMDVMMPGMDGIRATVKMRERGNFPVIMLSAKTEDADKVFGLNMGADDYVTKPFSPLELLARVRSQLRRYTQLGSFEQKKGIYRTGELVLDDETKEVTVDGEPIRLTPVEFGVLRLLTQNAGRVFTTSQIYESVWNEQAFSPENTVSVHIRHIREKIEINPKEPKYLKVVWGLGYKVEKYPVF